MIKVTFKIGNIMRAYKIDILSMGRDTIFTFQFSAVGPCVCIKFYISKWYQTLNAFLELFRLNIDQG